MFDEQYAYATARIKAIEKNLLSETQLERLLSAQSVPEAFKVLQDTFLAPYLSAHERTHLGKALDASIGDAKKLIAAIAPDPELLNVLWLKYDFFNLHTVIKGKRMKLSDDEIVDMCFSSGTFTPQTLVEKYNTDALSSLDPLLGEAAKKAQDAEQIYNIDIAMNVYYFAAARRIAQEKNDPFLTAYVTLLIDLFNLKTALRALSLAESDIAGVWIEGGQFSRKDLETKEKIVELFPRIGGHALWTQALKEYEETGDYSLIEKTSDEYVASYLKEKSNDLFSAATLFAYFSAKKNNAQLISSIMTEKEAGLKEGEIRYIFRRLYV